ICSAPRPAGAIVDCGPSQPASGSSAIIASRLTRLLLQRDLQLVNFGGQDEVIFRQSVDGVSRQLDSDIAVTGQMHVGMMILGLGDCSNAPEELDPRCKILHLPTPADELTAVRQF